MAFLGYYRRFVPRFSHVAAPLTQLLSAEHSLAEWAPTRPRFGCGCSEGSPYESTRPTPSRPYPGV